MRRFWFLALVCAVALMFTSGPRAVSQEEAAAEFVMTRNAERISAPLLDTIRLAVEERRGDPEDWVQFDLDEGDSAILNDVAQLLEGNCLEVRIALPLRTEVCSGARVASWCLSEVRLVARPIENCGRLD